MVHRKAPRARDYWVQNVYCGETLWWKQSENKDLSVSSWFGRGWCWILDAPVEDWEGDKGGTEPVKDANPLPIWAVAANPTMGLWKVVNSMGLKVISTDGWGNWLIYPPIPWVVDGGQLTEPLILWHFQSPLSEPKNLQESDAATGSWTWVQGSLQQWGWGMWAKHRWQNCSSLAQEIRHAHQHHLDNCRKAYSWALFPAFLVGSSGVGPRNMYLWNNGLSCIHVSVPGMLGDPGNRIVGGGGNQFLN